MKVSFDYSEWNQSSHLKSPRGFGSWCFSTHRDVEWASDQETQTAEGVRVSPTGYMWVNQVTFTQARKIAAQVAQRFGWNYLYVQP